VCDAAFHKKWYFDFDDVTRISEISDCCPVQSGATCFADVTIESSDDGVDPPKLITVSEHSHAWAFNRCRCTECTMGYPSVPPSGMVCGEGAHTLGGSAY
jgi:hypothetical protein